MKIKQYIMLPLLSFVLVGAGCASGEQKTIASPTSGKTDAKVKVVEYFDYQCGACGNAHKNVVPFIIEDFVKTGKAQITYKNMAFLGPDSRNAANAALCAHEQGKFEEYHDKVFDNQGVGEKSDFSISRLKQFGKDIGLDSTQFDTCVDDNRYRGQISSELTEAGQKGVTATPTYFVNNEKIVGGSYLTLKRAIEKALGE